MTGATWNSLPPTERQAIIEHSFPKCSIYYGTWAWFELPESIRHDLESVSVYAHKPQWNMADEGPMSRARRTNLLFEKAVHYDGFRLWFYPDYPDTAKTNPALDTLLPDLTARGYSAQHIAELILAIVNGTTLPLIYGRRANPAHVEYIRERVK